MRSLSVEPVYAQGRTTQGNAVVEVTVSAAQDATSYEVSVDGRRVSTQPRSGDTTRFQLDVSPGVRQVSVVPISQFEPPTAGSRNGGPTQRDVAAAGAPSYNSVSEPTSTGESISIASASLNTNSSALPSTQRIVVWRNGQTPSCGMTGGRISISGGQASGEVAPNQVATVSGLERNTVYNVMACASNGYGAVQGPTRTVVTWGGGAEAPAGDLEYSVSSTRAGGTAANVFEYRLASTPNPTAENNFRVFYRFDGGNRTQDFGIPFGREYGSITTEQCLTFLGFESSCGTPASIEPAPGSAPAPMQLVFPQDAVPTGPFGEPVDYQYDRIQLNNASVSGNPRISVTAQVSGSSVIYTAQWLGDYAGLEPVQFTRPYEPPTEPPTEQPSPSPSAPATP